MDSPNFYAILPFNVRRDENLMAEAKILYSEINALSNMYKYCYASNAYFADAYHVDERTIRRWLNNLVECGYIRVEYSADTDKRARKLIPLGENAPVARTKLSESPDNPVQPGQNCPETPDKIVQKPGQNCPEEYYKNNTRDNTTTRARGFDRFWAAYPRKVGKGAAEKSYERIKPDAQLITRMLMAISVQKNSDTWKRGYIPNPATWLNQRRWDDEVESGTAQPSAYHQPASTEDRPREIGPDTDILDFL